MRSFHTLYDPLFPKKIIRFKAKNVLNPWIKTGIAKSSKQKQKLYEMFLKIESEKNEKNLQNIKKTYSEKLMKSKGNAKKT